MMVERSSSSNRRRWRRIKVAGLYLAVILFLATRCMAQQEEEVGEKKNTEEVNTAPGSGVRMVTLEELGRNDGNQTDRLWLSILGKVYDVTAGEQYYRKGAPYQIFVGKDANVPFITGNFTEEEAKRPLVSLSPVELYSLETWSDFYDKEEKYKFVGLLIGELYDEQGNPTEAHEKVKEMIDEGKREQEERKRKRKELIAQRKRENDEKKKNRELLGNAQGTVKNPEQEL